MAQTRKRYSRPLCTQKSLSGFHCSLFTAMCSLEQPCTVIMHSCPIKMVRCSPTSVRCQKINGNLAPHHEAVRFIHPVWPVVLDSKVTAEAVVSLQSVCADRVAVASRLLRSTMDQRESNL